MSSDFIREEKKKKPVNKQKIIRKFLISAVSAVLFGVVASLVMLLMYPFLQKLLNNNKPAEPVGLVTLPENTNEMSPEEMLSEYMMQESALLDVDENGMITEQVDVPLSDEQIQSIISKVSLDVTSYRQLATSMAALARELGKYMVTVTSKSTTVDWMNSVNDAKNITSGIAFAKNKVDLFILVDSTRINKNDELVVTFSNGVSIKGELREIDPNTKLAVVAVSISDIPSDMNIDDFTAKLGSSNGLYVGLPVMVVGSPRGISGSMGYGIIDIPRQNLPQTDSYVTTLQTNIAGSSMASGAMFNLQGQVIGIITNNIESTSGNQVITAYGITELKNRIEKMSNGVKLNYLGINGTDVTQEAFSELGVPQGAYIVSTKMDSPAMRAGIQMGDVIVSVDGTSINTYADFVALLNLKNVGEEIRLGIKRKSHDYYTSIDFTLTVEAF